MGQVFYLVIFGITSLVWQSEAFNTSVRASSDENDSSECSSDDDCADALACPESSCIDPCELADLTCDCETVNHKAQCYRPRKGKQRRCKEDGDCKRKHACFEGSCVNPCFVPIEAQCDTSFSKCVIVEHQALCRCYHKSSFSSCPVSIDGKRYIDPFLPASRAPPPSPPALPALPAPPPPPPPSAPSALQPSPPPSIPSAPSALPSRTQPLPAPVSGGKKTFVIPNIKASWVEALNYCTDMGMQLAIIENAEENKRAVRTAKRYSLTWNIFWIAGQYHGDSRWWWHTNPYEKGKLIDYYNFHLNMPAIGIGNCLAYISLIPIGIIMKGYRWVAKPCGFNEHFICQKYE